MLNAFPLCFDIALISDEIAMKTNPSKFDSRTKTIYLNTPSEPTLIKIINPLIPKPSAVELKNKIKRPNNLPM